MLTYTIYDWVLFFFFYAFLGWIWESCYSSVRQKRLVNRGFLHGPIIPIYGFGALMVLLVTLGVRDSDPALFLYGMTGASLLEYLTGFVMERIFHVKYWDYSNFPFNLNGYICLYASLAWGAFSVLLIRVIHPPIETFVFEITPVRQRMLCAGLCALGLVDTVQSGREAFDLRDMLERLETSKEEITRLQKRLAITSAFRMEDLSIHVAGMKERINPFRLRSHFMRNMRLMREERTRELRDLLSRLETTAVGEPLKLKDRVLQELEGLGARRDKEYRSIARILSRNPGALSRKYRAAMEELSNLMK